MNDVLVLCYHAVSSTWPAALCVTPAKLEHQLDSLLARGYEAVTFTQAVQAPPGRRTLAVTFDDGFESVHRLARPILRKRDIPATLFVPSTYVGTGEPLSWPGIDHWLEGEHAPELASCSWEQIRELRDDGWEIGSHTRTHPQLTTLDDARLDEELRSSKIEIEDRLGAACTSIAYPYGDVDARVAVAAGRAGYTAAGTLPDRFPPRPKSLMWPRLGVYLDEDALAFRRHSSLTYRRLMASWGWPAAVYLHRRGTALRALHRPGRQAAPGGEPPPPS